MPRTVTGTYTLRPTSFNRYLSSGTFSNYFSSTSAPSSGWTNSLAPGTRIGDNSDSTYADYGTVGTSANTGKNAIMNTTVTSGSVPLFNYTITAIKLHYRAKARYQSNASRMVKLYNTLWYGMGDASSVPKTRINNGYFGVMNAQVSSSSVHVCETSITTKTVSITPPSGKSNLDAGTYPDFMAVCLVAYRTSAFTAMTNVYLYDIWWEISYSYTEYEVDISWKNDEGVTVTTGGNSLDASATYSDYRGTQYPLVASVKPGYIFDGYYLNGVKVSSNPAYTLTFNDDSDELYCITKKRKIFVGDRQVDEIYIGTTPVTEIYDGDTCIWGLSDLYGDATAVG